MSVLAGGSTAQSATNSVSVSTNIVAIDSNGLGKVNATCSASTTCRGSIYLLSNNKWPMAYSIPARSSKLITLKVSSLDPRNPHIDDNGEPRSARAATLTVNGDSPTNKSTTKTVTLERRVSQQTISGRLTGTGAAPSDVEVSLVTSSLSDGTPTRKDTVSVSPGGEYEFKVALGTNNASSTVYRIYVTGRSGGQARSWYWRGSNGTSAGGARYVRDATLVQASKYGPYVADITYGSIAGSVLRQSNKSVVANSTVTVAGAPAAYVGSSSGRNLDLFDCANVYGEVPVGTDGRYEVGFLPANVSKTEQKYLVQSSSPTAIEASGFTNAGDRLMNLWAGNESAPVGSFRSCQHATGYTKSRSRLIALSAGKTSASRNLEMRPASSNITGKVSWSGFSPTSGDRQVVVREAEAGKKILDNKVVDRAYVGSSNTFDADKLAPGRYWVEIGRQTACQDWYPSRFTDNHAYHKGVDRQYERWRTVNGTDAEYQKSYDMGYKKTTPPRGYKGWMYRDHCKSGGQGRYYAVWVGDAETERLAPTVKRGATIRGKVTRSGGRTNKEMLVSVYSTVGTLVMRTDLTDGSGNFEITGLDAGNYRIGVNTDSWRGIGRSFSGTQTKRVTAGNSYSVGTLKFSG